MADYGGLAREEIEKAMHEFKHHGKYKNRKQAIAAALNKARAQSTKTLDSQ